MSKASGSALGLIQRLYSLPLHMRMGRDHHLADAFAIRDGKGLRREVHQDDPDLSPIIRINGAWRVQQGQPMLESQATARA